MEVKVQFFAVLKDHFSNEISVEIENGSRIEDLQKKLSVMNPFAEKILNHSLFAIEDSVLGLDRSLSHGDQILVLPPVSGG